MKWLEIRDDRGVWQDRYDLDGSLVAVVGPIDRGKTSMTECLDFLFGRQVRFRGAVDQRLRAVRAEMEIGDGTYVVRRDRSRAGVVQVADAGGTPVGEFPLESQGEVPSWSTWLLMQLGLDEKFASVRLPKDKRLTFTEDLLPFLHIRQEDIDRFVVRPASQDDRRLAVLNLLLHLSDPEAERLAGAITDLDNHIKSQRRKKRQITEFLDDSEATSSAALAADLAALRERERQARDALAGLRRAVDAAAAHAAHLHAQVDQARTRLTTAEDGADWVRRRHQEARSKVTALEKSLARLEAVTDASPQDRDRLALEYLACPACETDLRDRVVEPGQCSLCTAPLPGSALVKEKAHLRQALDAARTALAGVEKDLVSSGEAVRLARERLDIARRAVDAHLAAATAPHLDAIAAATGELEALRAQITALSRLRVPHDRLTAIDRDVQDRQGDLDVMRERHQRLLAGLVRPDVALTRLNSLFRQIVRKFGLPWATGRARMDPTTWTPLVDEQDFDQRGGGSRTAVSVAYSLALLLYALEDPEGFHLPHLLILDSPQKNFGRNSHDQGLATRMYDWLTTYLTDRRESLGGRYHDFQLIIVDNNIPGMVEKHFKPLHRFRDTAGFIRGLDHPHGPPVAGRQLELDEPDDEDFDSEDTDVVEPVG
ncbi:hypothetical protein ACFXGA_18555 [Actinosynnema sp. NPDC059335]|uniref:hypothetical protein n=1 Tax=Actinosynnema sp. NPDC059335 TaxID=3346804 RepID=UPI00366ACAC8